MYTLFFLQARLWQSLVLQAQAAVPRRDRLRDCLPREHLQGRLPRLSSAEPLLPGVGSHGYSGLNWRGQRCGWVWVLRAFLSGEGELPRAARQPLGKCLLQEESAGCTRGLHRERGRLSVKRFSANIYGPGQRKTMTAGLAEISSHKIFWGEICVFALFTLAGI